MSGPTYLVPGVIAEGDVVAVAGDLAFARTLASHLGQGVGMLRNADLDRRADFHAEVNDDGQIVITRPWRPNAAPVVVDDLTPAPELRALIFHVGDTARQGDHIRSLAPVLLDAVSPAFARVIRIGGRPIAGMALRLVDGEIVATTLAPSILP